MSLETENKNEQQVNAETTSKNKFQENNQVIAYLTEKFPLCFSTQGEAKPLKIGIFQDLAERLKDDETVSNSQLRRALRQYTAGWRYLHGYKPGAKRVDLDGNPCGEVELQHIAHAEQRLQESKAKKFGKAAEARDKQPKEQRTRKPNYKKGAAKGDVRRRPALVPVDLSNLQETQQVKIKVGEKTQVATVIAVNKDSVRVELAQGLILTVTEDRVFQL
ncbi:RNA chaperone ProQ [Gallibacterium genomosp. 3]|uniref:RNA chaperone ProQ n=1 Tax=Gallibacterium genomosp. 3 TaxID=505345 RepID=A0A1A7PXF4_9PAST|nr:RNA chaperone ProQ [Gallibacterium genomosp. 3]OBX06431.1 prop expression regulator [Gallibacterium genomosp. 3]